jgi:hypothetical protein
MTTPTSLLERFRAERENEYLRSRNLLDNPGVQNRLQWIESLAREVQEEGFRTYAFSIFNCEQFFSEQETSLVLALIIYLPSLPADESRTGQFIREHLNLSLGKSLKFLDAYDGQMDVNLPDERGNPAKIKIILDFNK